ncbi:MAG: hypothetical protein WAO02_01175 [Verrucomicrobiia bacterium]
MPPTFAYVMCLMAYLALMVVGLAVCVLLCLMPSKRRLALRLCLAILGSLPGILAFQFIVGVPLGILLAIVLGFYSAFHPPDWVQGVVGIPTILIMFVTLAAASLLGCYTGGRIGWQTGAGVSLRLAITEQRVIRYVLSWFKKRGA